jgi:N-ethylmaleimide reductase
VLEDYSQGARNAKEAGLDGIEVHGANGYLFDQFLNSTVNERDDEYGTQTKESRARLLLEAYDRVAAVFGAERVGVRISPFGSFGGMKPDPKVYETFLYVAEELKRRGAVYVHIVRGSQNDPEPVVPEEFFQAFRKAFGQSIIVTGGLDQLTAEKLIAEDIADLAGFGTLFISNSDLPARFEHSWPLNEPDQTTFYGGGAIGYTDYPAYQE